MDIDDKCTQHLLLNLVRYIQEITYENTIFYCLKDIVKLLNLFIQIDIW